MEKTGLIGNYQEYLDDFPDPAYRLTFVQGGHKLKLHPDRQAWEKCCGNKVNCQCAFRKYPADHPRLAARMMPNTYRFYDTGDDKVFVCPHQKTEDGYLRVCAGWSRKFPKKFKAFIEEYFK